jgi:hypothetical protein
MTHLLTQATDWVFRSIETDSISALTTFWQVKIWEFMAVGSMIRLKHQTIIPFGVIFHWNKVSKSGCKKQIYSLFYA